jgi:hypothetical protein
MSCNNEPLLITYGIMIDDFSIKDNTFVNCILLSHAHTDHLKGFSSFSKKSLNIPIYCTETTKQLISCVYENIDKIQIITPGLFKEFKIKDNIIIQFLPSYHCDGAVMFLIHFIQENKTILITNDFRYSPKMRTFDSLTKIKIDKLYYDNTFDLFDYPIATNNETYENFKHIIHKLSVNKTCKKIYINCSILGFEPILRLYAHEHKIKYTISESLQNSWRGKQLQILLKDYINNNNNFQNLEKNPISFHLAHRRLDQIQKDGKWIIPTCTIFKCKNNFSTEKTFEKDDKIYIEFCTHSNREEIQELKLIVGVNSIESCDYKQNFTKCNSSNFGKNRPL